MTTGGAAQGQLYPAYCFALSPTFSRWVKLTAADLHSLRALPTFADQAIYFHLNHPIRFVYLCGPIVGIRSIPDDSASVPYYVLLDIDDSSGQTVEVKIRTIKPKAKQEHRNGKQASQSLEEGHDDGSAQSAESDSERRHKTADRSSTLKTLMVDTVVENISITNTCAVKGCRDKHVLLDDKLLDLYTVIKAKGTITTYNDLKQIELERAFVVRTTDEETRIWDEYTTFCQSVLSKPWRLDKAELRRVERADRERASKAANKNKKEQAESQAKERRRAKRQEKYRVRELEEEQRRHRETAELDGHPLDVPKWKQPKSKLSGKFQKTKNG